MPKYDTRCSACKHEEEIIRRGTEPNPPCSVCGAETVVYWKSVPVLDKAKDPYDLLSGRGSKPDGKRIFSGPNVSSKTTV